MYDVFLSYTRVDAATAKTIAGALENEGFSVWWDRNIPPGKSFQKMIEDAIKASRSVVVLWSTNSIESRYVNAEALIADDLKILVPARIDPIIPPYPFTNIQAADLTDWKAGTFNTEFNALIESIREKLRPDVKDQMVKFPESINQAESIRPETINSKAGKEKSSFSAPKPLFIKLIFLIGGFTLSIITAILFLRTDLFRKLWIYDQFLVYYIIGALAVLTLIWVVLKCTDSEMRVRATKLVFSLLGFLVAIVVIWRGVIDWIYISSSTCGCNTPQCQPPYLYTSHNFLPYVALATITISILILIIRVYTSDPFTPTNRLTMYTYLAIFCGYLLTCRLAWEIADQITKHYKPCL